MNFDGQQVRDEFQAAFGRSIEELTTRQLWWMVKVIKHCRGRCRQNTALNNYLNRNFTGANFREIPVPGATYKKLQITVKGDVFVPDERDEEK